MRVGKKNTRQGTNKIKGHEMLLYIVYVIRRHVNASDFETELSGEELGTKVYSINSPSGIGGPSR